MLRFIPIFKQYKTKLTTYALINFENSEQFSQNYIPAPALTSKVSVNSQLKCLQTLYFAREED